MPLPIYIIERPEPVKVTFDLVTDVQQQIIDNFISIGRVFHEDDLHFICHRIECLFDYYKIESQNYDEMVDAVKISTTKYFIRIYNYGALFKFVLMMKLPDGTNKNFTYEY